MAKSCQDVSARMLELIYGELGDDERAALVELGHDAPSAKESAGSG